jgi:hypothetical protein
MRKISRKFVAIDPETGLYVRRAKPHEVRAYRKGNSGRARPFTSRAFDHPVRVGNVLIDVHTGSGVWFGGAGF